MRIIQILTYSVLLFSFSFLNASTGEIVGKITDADTGEPAVGVTVYASSNGFDYPTFTDEEGKYVLKPLPPGNYTLHLSYPGYQPIVMEKIPILADQSVVIDYALETFYGNVIVVKPEPEVVEYVHPLMDPINPTVCPVLTAEDLQRMPVSSLPEALAQAPGIIVNDDGSIQVRAARPGSTTYLVDGVKVRSLRGVPLNVVSTSRILNSFIPAKYGDTTGGVVLVETHSYFSR